MEKYFGIVPFGATPNYRQLDHMKMAKTGFTKRAFLSE